MRSVALVILAICITSSAFASGNVNSVVTGDDATLVTKALRAAKVKPRGGKDGLSISTRSIVCDVSPDSRASCIIIRSNWFTKPIVVGGSVARDLFDALSNADAVANPNEPQCDSGLCSLQFAGVDCSGSNADGDTCTLK